MGMRAGSTLFILRDSSYRWNEELDNKLRHIGFIRLRIPSQFATLWAKYQSHSNTQLICSPLGIQREQGTA
jgi:hypothetical protein